LSAYTNLTIVEKLRDLVEKLTKDFRGFEKDLGMQKFLVKRDVKELMVLRKNMFVFLQGSKM
jgi:hypothetical protein